LKTLPNQDNLPTVSIVIRNRNEGRELRNLLSLLTQQEYPSDRVEIVVVDNESDDDSVQVAREFNARVINLPYEEFTFAHAANLGCQNATGELLVFFSSHSIPMSNKLLAHGVRHFVDPKVVGVFGPCVPYEDSLIYDWIIYWQGYFWYRLRRLFGWRNEKSRMGLLGLTNAIVRRSVLVEEPYDESNKWGGEDSLWAQAQLAKGRVIRCDPWLSVRHTHRMRSLAQVRKQFEVWVLNRKFGPHHDQLDRQQKFGFRTDHRYER
jgi:rhamnosyltransferase